MTRSVLPIRSCVAGALAAALAGAIALRPHPSAANELDSGTRLTPVEDLGRQLFEDPTLSLTGTASCATCHDARRAFTGNNAPDPRFPVAVGDGPDRVGSRNVPSAMYAKFIPAFSFVEDDGAWSPRGGQFLDGRADSLDAQAAMPLLDPREMAMPSEAAVVARVRAAPYARTFRRVFGPRIFDDVGAAYAAVTTAIAAFEHTAVFSPFSSKFDAVLRGQAAFTEEEASGFALFEDPEKGNCLACHLGDPKSDDPQAWLFTDFSYDNLGIPRNPEIPANADPASFDLGVCAQPGLRARIPAEAGDPEALVGALCGAFRVPTLRNVAVTAPYMHNGHFESLDQVVDFYVTRDTNPERWYPIVEGVPVKFDDAPPASRDNVNTDEVPYDRSPGDEPRLSPRGIEQVVAFLETLTDGYEPRGGPPTGQPTTGSSSNP